CIISENKLLLAKLHLDLIKTAGYINEFESYSIPKMTNTHLDEQLLLNFRPSHQKTVLLYNL
ncbi:hypothetical protein EWM06_20400, partial [Clostridioides difficile]